MSEAGAGEAVAGERWDDGVERRTVDAVGVWICQERHERKHLDEGAGPAMGQDQRYPAPAWRPLMDEVDVHAIELGTEVIERVQHPLLRTPVELAGPIRKRLSQVVEVGALLPGNARHLIRPARVADARPEVRQNLLLDIDREGLDARG
jgi:hypothetical protein